MASTGAPGPEQGPVLWLFNGRAGQGAVAASLSPSIEAACTQRGREARILCAKDGADFDRMLEEAAASPERLVVAGGGDGTINAVAGAILKTGKVLGVLPLGTLNHFARDLGLPADTDGAIATVLDGTSRRIDIGEVNGAPFLNNSSLGLYPRLVRLREAEQRHGWRKSLALVRAAAALFQAHEDVTVTIAGDGVPDVTLTTPLVFIGNNIYGLDGPNFGRRQCLDAGLLCLYAVKRRDIGGLAWLALRTLVGQGRGADLETRSVRALRIEADRPDMEVATDGEVRRLPLPLDYRVRPGALAVMVPPDAGGSRDAPAEPGLQ